MVIGDRIRAEQHLSRQGYYRLSGYWYPMRRPGPGKTRLDLFLPGADFCDVANLYVWDKKLRGLMLDAIERLEVGIRVTIAYESGKKDAFLHCRPDLMGVKPSGMRDYAQFFTKHSALEKQSKEEFVKHFRKEYDGEIPIWVAIELWEFGLINQFYALLDANTKYLVSSRFGLKPDTFASWLDTLRYVRNVCAHHARLWNRELVEIPAKPHAGECPEAAHAFTAGNGTNSKLYPTLCLIVSLLRGIQPASEWPRRMKDHLLQFPHTPHCALRDMGVPAGWDTQSIWL